MSDTLNTFQDTIHHTVMDTVRSMEIIKSNPDGFSLKDNTAIIISIISVLFTGLGLFLNYRMRKKNFQTEIFKKQMEAYEILQRNSMMLHKQLRDRYKEIKEWNEMSHSSYQKSISSIVEEYYDDMTCRIIFFQSVVYEAYDGFLEVIIKIHSGKYMAKDEFEKYLNSVLDYKITKILQAVSKHLAIEKLSHSTYRLLNGEKIRTATKK